jgi:CheY-like chemotaxis protein
MFNKENAKILVADDSEDNRLILERRLKQDGYKNIVMADGGQSALESMQKTDFDLILLDYMMPDVSGLDVLKKIKGDPNLRHIPIIMVTALDEIEKVADCILSGADDFITKPFNATLLKARVSASLEKKRLRDIEADYLRRVEAEKKKSQKFLKTVLPSAVASELQSSGFIRSRRYDDVAILICDLVGFTSFCENNNPEEVISALQELVEKFEVVFEQFGLEKIKTVGDAIVAVAGLSYGNADPVQSCVDCGKVMREISNGFRQPFGLHVGVHMGSLVAGTVGNKTLQFDILGKSVNIAFDICDMSESNQVLISSDAWMTARTSLKVRSLGLKRLKSGVEIELLEGL